METTLMQNVARAIRDEADARGWNQSDLARAAGIKHATARRYFYSEEREPTIERVRLVAKALGLTVSEIFRRAEVMLEAQGRIEAGTATPHDRLEAMNITPAEKARLHELMDELGDDVIDRDEGEEGVG